MYSPFNSPCSSLIHARQFDWREITVPLKINEGFVNFQFSDSLRSKWKFDVFPLIFLIFSNTVEINGSENHMLKFKIIYLCVKNTKILEIKKAIYSVRTYLIVLDNRKWWVTMIAINP